MSVLRGLVLLALLSGCSRDEATAPPHVIVLSLDTVRADRLGCYGGDPSATPRLDAFAAGSDRYRACVATAPWTLPSHASMFTGLFPFEHGTHGFRVDEYVDNVHPLHPDHVTLAEGMSAAGYETAAFVANTVYLANRFGLAQGFETYEVRRQPARAMTDRALEFLDTRGSDRPCFLFVNFMDAHRPYGMRPHAELARLPAHEHPAQLLERLCEQVMLDGEAPGPLGERVSGLYDEGLRGLDREVGRLLEGLAARGLLEGALILVTSDHGEAFGDHGVVEHGKDLYESLVSVPLIVKAPGQAEGRVLEPVASLVDVPGLIAAAIPGPSGSALRSDFGRLPGRHPVTTEVHFARPRELQLYGERFQRERVALRAGRFKLIASGGEVELYDLEADPGELEDLAGVAPGRVGELKRQLDSFLDAAAYQGERLLPAPPTPVQRVETRVLGYSGGK
ncbi:MAG: sulfatase [Planctomycetota bacterium]|nr:sulfatase [Planctomycetota bacterium]MDG1984118.1 sulfatase [Planctomycetota bacterium]